VYMHIFIHSLSLQDHHNLKGEIYTGIDVILIKY